MGKSFSEAELAKFLIDALILEGWDCYPEVALGKLLGQNLKDNAGSRLIFGEPIADVVAIKDGLVMIVECKKSFSLEVIEQALEWSKISPLYAIAIPFAAFNNRSVVKTHLREYYGLGIFGISATHAQWRFKPKLKKENLKYCDEIKSILKPTMMLSTAGAAHTWRSTPYQDTMFEIRCYLAMHGPTRLKDLYDFLEGKENGKCVHHYSSRASMVSSIGKSIYGGVEPDFVVSDDKILTWNPALCRHGSVMVENIKDCAQRRLRYTA